MLVKDIYQEVKEITGSCDEAVVFNAITRGIKLLAARSLCDPLVGYLRMTVDDGYLLAMPAEVHSVLKVNIDGTPAFYRTKLYEFQHNSEGSNDGESIGFSWADRLRSPIQDERGLPGRLKYICTVPTDVGKSIRVLGKDTNGRDIEEKLTAALSGAAGTRTFHQITAVIREATAAECLLYVSNTIDSEEDSLCGQYYPNETQPLYRAIKLSKTGVSVRIMFRRRTWSITSQEDIIPMDSEDAVIMAAKAVRARQADELEKYAMFLEEAVKVCEAEQTAQDKAKEIAESTQVSTAIDFAIHTRDSVVAGDVYDVAADIFGPVGKHKLLDRITDAVDILRNKAFWDAGVGFVNIWTNDRTKRINYMGGEGDGRFTLPRFVETPISINYDHRPTIPRNRWYEFHINGFGSTKTSTSVTWDDCGETVLRQQILIDPETREPVPTQFLAVCEETHDIGAYVRIYGREKIEGVVRDVWRDGVEGWLCPCDLDVSALPEDAPWFVEINRISRRETRGFVKLVEALKIAEAIPAHEGFVPVATGFADSGGTDYAFTTTFPDRHPLPGETIRIEGTAPGLPFESVVQYTVSTPPAHQVYCLDTTPTEGEAEAIVSIYESIPEVPSQYAAGDIFGYWYPDEVEPKYRMIRINTAKVQMIRMMYRRRTVKITSLYQPLHLRSRRAIELAMRADNATATDIQAAELFEEKAVRLLSQERINETPSDTPAIAFDPGTMPGWTGNIQ